MKITTAVFLLFTAFINCLAQAPPTDRQQFIRVEAPVVALTHVRVIDGTGAAPLKDQTIVIVEGKIQSIAPSATAKTPANARILDLQDYTVLPGLVGIHHPVFFPMPGTPTIYSIMASRSPRPHLPPAVPPLPPTSTS